MIIVIILNAIEILLAITLITLSSILWYQLEKDKPLKALGVTLVMFVFTINYTLANAIITITALI